MRLHGLIFRPGILSAASARSHCFRRNWRGLPADVKAVIARNLNGAGEDQRADYANSDGKMRTLLEQQGMVFNEPDPEAFRQVLIKAGFYDKWKVKYGAESWAVLEKYAGQIGS